MTYGPMLLTVLAAYGLLAFFVLHNAKNQKSNRERTGYTLFLEKKWFLIPYIILFTRPTLAKNMEYIDFFLSL